MFKYFAGSWISYILLPQLLYSNTLLQGYVVNKKNEAPLFSAYVYWQNEEKTVLTDVNGYFEIPMTKDSILVIKLLGFATQKYLITDQKELVLRLSEESEQLETVEITVKKPTTEISLYSTMKTETLGKNEFRKAACCNLSESFETNATIDVAYTDAVSGTKQIQLLGLSGTYALISSENIPVFTGNANVSGLEIIPGQWLESVQLIKGSGSVINGFQSITGQINTEYQSPLDDQDGFFNLYTDNAYRTEVNWIQHIKLSPHKGIGIFVQGDYAYKKMDMNGNGFMDNPIGPKLVAMTTWINDNPTNNWETRGGVKLAYFDKQSGQIRGNTPYTINNNFNRLEVWNKTGYLFPKSNHASIGIQNFAVIQEHDLQFGLRNLLGKETRITNNLLYQNILGNTSHRFTVGATQQYQELSNTLKLPTPYSYGWNEHLVGSFVEYSYTPTEKFSLVGGLRVDYSNIWKTLITPRIHTRYEVFKRGVWRASGGLGTKNPNPFMENIGVFASSRNLSFSPEDVMQQREQAWNWGTNFTQKFDLDYREAVFSVDFYHTNFINKTLVDLDFSPQEIHFYNLNQGSFANSFMTQFSWEIIKFLKFTSAYRYYQVENKYQSVGWQQQILTPQHRFFVNTDYEVIKNLNWDLTLSWTSSSRLPQSNTNPNEYQWNSQSPNVFIVNTQLRYVYQHLDVYIGAQNLLNKQQKNPVISAQDPFGNYFDASIVYAPVFGRMVYFGLSFALHKAKKED